MVWVDLSLALLFPGRTEVNNLFFEVDDSVELIWIRVVSYLMNPLSRCCWDTLFLLSPCSWDSLPKFWHWKEGNSTCPPVAYSQPSTSSSILLAYVSTLQATPHKHGTFQLESGFRISRWRSIPPNSWFIFTFFTILLSESNFTSSLFANLHHAPTQLLISISSVFGLSLCAMSHRAPGHSLTLSTADIGLTVVRLLILSFPFSMTFRGDVVRSSIGVVKFLGACSSLMTARKGVRASDGKLLKLTSFVADAARQVGT